jgi:DNA mismatch repair ATPase MutS
MMKQFFDLKTKHPDAILLFRCGDFYETYCQDAVEASAILGITLTKRNNGGENPTEMAGFPHHALDTYLPKLVRAANSGQMKFKRLAICDQLDPPPGPRPKRGESETSNSSDNQNSEDIVMTNENVKVADLIGKSVCNGNAKYVIKSVDGDKVKVDFAMGDNAAKEMNMKVEQIEKLLQGGWTVSDGTQEPTAKQESTAKQEAPKTEKPKAEQPAKPKVTLRKKQPQTKAEEPKQEQSQGMLTYSTYTNAKGKTCAKVSGFAETDAAYQKEAAASLHGSATYENSKQGRVNFLLFGPRYAEVAKTVCQMLNEGKTVADCQAVVDRATEERQQKREERMAKREERKQKREAYRQEREGRIHQTSDINHQPSSGKTYTEAEVVELMNRVITGDKEAIAIINAMAA